MERPNEQTVISHARRAQSQKRKAEYENGKHFRKPQKSKVTAERSPRQQAIVQGLGEPIQEASTSSEAAEPNQVPMPHPSPPPTSAPPQKTESVHKFVLDSSLSRLFSSSLRLELGEYRSQNRIHFHLRTISAPHLHCICTAFAPIRKKW